MSDCQMPSNWKCVTHREEDLELDDLKVIREEKTQKDLKEVLAKYGIDGNGIGAIRQFPSKIYSLEDDDEELKQCIREIKRSHSSHFAIYCQENNKKREIVGKENTGAIKALEELICITEGILYQVVISFAQNRNKNPLNIRFIESALKENSEDEKELCKNVKQVIEVIVGLLKDRIEISCIGLHPELVIYF
ncbi:hypothetical protein C1646_767855 [Rhizophagus diaphanus]|nr:hypothetical protein C1646_767855 [Rhizophagus diaphanus] [Rhizophagus sp. MUCL 43196]